MSIELLTGLILALVAAVVVALFLVMWNERRSPTEARVAIASGGVLAAWAVADVLLAARGAFILRPEHSIPPVAIGLLLALAGLSGALLASPSLRRLLSNQASLIRLNLWRLVGAVFLLLMWTGQMPALWAVPAGGGDVLVGLAALPVAKRVNKPGGRKIALVFNLLGLLDLVVAVGLGTMTSTGPFQLFHTTPTSDFVSRFPLVLVPTFLVPLAVMVHVVSLWHLGREKGADPIRGGTVAPASS